MTRICKTCGGEKPIEEFAKYNGKHKKVNGGYRPHCLVCYRAYILRMHHKHKHKHVWTESKRRSNRNCKLKKAYGITLEDYEAMLEAQGGKCAICGTTEESARGRIFSVDHCHITGVVRGILCSNCNNGLGRFKDNRELLSKAIEYLSK